MSKPQARRIPRLPRLVAGSSEWQLPLSEGTSSELARILATDALTERESRAAELMSVDPVLTLWTACCAGRWGGAAPRCVVDLAQWLARHALSVLKWPETDGWPGAAQRDHRARWRELSADAIAVANVAADQAQDDAVAAEAFLFGLLHNAPDWLRSCGPRISLARSESGCLPAWLVTLLRQRSKPPRPAPVELVLRARALWREAGRQGKGLGGVDLADVMAARKRWQTTSATPREQKHFLQVCSEKFRRLEALEHRFDQTLEREKLASLGELAYGASHEINNPLANISTRAQALLAQESNPEKRRMLAIINSQVFRAHEMIADMMLYARPPAPVPAAIDLNDLVRTVTDELRETAELQGTRFSVHCAEAPVVVFADPAQTAVALRAICVNALEALVAEGKIEVTVDQLAPSGNDLAAWGRVAIHDGGPGIPPEVRSHLFDPFYSGREAGRGLGLGLSKCWRVVTLNGGRVDVVSRQRQGTTVTVCLPLPAAAAADREECDGTTG